MKQVILAGLVIAGFSACSKTDMAVPVPDGTSYNTGKNAKSDSLGKLLKEYAGKGIPGLVLAIKDANGFWMGSAGFASLEEKKSMSPTMLQYGRSITKMFTATAIMQLKEKGLIDLDKPIKTYLPANKQNLVPSTDIITARMLLNQTSGYTEYNETAEFQEKWLDNPLITWKRSDLEGLIERTTRVQFRPGSDFAYSNTNYYLLSLIIDQVTGRPHGEWFQQHIFDKLGLSQTFYKQSPGYPFYQVLPNTYYPRFDNKVLENNTKAQLAWEQSEEYGTVGIIATPENYIRFMEGLVEGRLVSDGSLQEMQQWITGTGSSEPDYGLGLSYWGYKNKPNFGHDGDAVGSHALLLYFPTSKTYLFLAANATTEFGGDIAVKIMELQNKAAGYLADF